MEPYRARTSHGDKDTFDRDAASDTPSEPRAQNSISGQEFGDAYTCTRFCLDTSGRYKELPCRRQAMLLARTAPQS